MSESRSDLREAFRQAGLRLTSQRCLILDVLRESDDHLDAESLHNKAKSRAADISLATVYRTLALLQELGLVEEHRLGEGHSHYEAVRDEPHYHFTCLGCGRVIEFDTPLVARIAQQLSEQKGLRIKRAHLHFTGYCERCQQEGLESGENNGPM